MTIKSELAALIVAGLQDIRCAAATVFLEQMFKRKEFGGGIPEYRITEVGTGNPINDLGEFLTHVTEDNITIAVSSVTSSNSFKDKCKPVRVVLENLEVKFFQDSLEDAFFNNNVGSYKNNICILMGYVSDNDPNLPMKILDLYLVGAQ